MLIDGCLKSFLKNNTSGAPDGNAVTRYSKYNGSVFFAAGVITEK